VSKVSLIDEGKISRFPLLYHLEIPFLIPNNVDLYHALSPIEALRLDKDRTVVTIHDLIMLRDTRQLYNDHNTLVKFVLKTNFAYALTKAIMSKKIIVNSEQTKMDLYDYLGGDKIDLSSIDVVRPIISSKFQPINIKNRDENIFVIGTLCGLAHHKRVDILINSFIKANIPNSKLLIAGRGPEMNRLIKLANGQDNIVFMGFIPDEDINQWYNSLDVFVFPSIEEGYGMPIIEAMATGCPVVTLDDSHIPKDIKNHTHVSNDLAYDLKNKKWLDSFDIKSNLDFVKQHSAKKISNQMIDIYNQI